MKRLGGRGALPYPFGPLGSSAPPDGGGVAIVSAQAGSWNNPTTWVGGVVPIIGNTVTVTHAIAVTANAEVGNGAAVKAIVASGLGNITINAGIKLTVNGSSDHSSTRYTLNSGSILEYSPPAATTYHLNLNTAHNQTSRIVVNDTLGTPAIIRKKPGSLGTFRVNDGGFIRGGQIDATNARLEGIDSWKFWPNNDADDFRLVNFVVDGCGLFTNPGGLSAGSDFLLQDGYFINSIGSDNLTINATAAKSIGTRRIQNVTFDKQLNYQSLGLEIKNVRCLGGFFCTNITAGVGNWDDLYVYKTGTSNINIPCGTLKGLYINKPAGNNPHFVQTNTNADTEIINFVCEHEGSEENGDFQLFPAPSVARTVNVHDCILLPNSIGRQSGSMITCSGGVNLTFKSNHNTYISTGGSTGVVVGETYPGHAGMCSEFKSNIAYDPTGNTAALKLQRVDGVVQDICAPANASHNTGWGLFSPTTDGLGYHAVNAPNVFSTAGFGVNDIDVAADPFFDRTRNLATWDASLGGPGTHANARAQMAVNNPLYNVPDLLDYIFAGFVVVTPALQLSGHDGADRGAARK